MNNANTTNNDKINMIIITFYSGQSKPSIAIVIVEYR